MNQTSAVHSLTALAHDARLRIFRILVGAGPEGLTPSILASMLALPASTLSFHLKELVNADLVTVEREGRQLFYRPNLIHMNELLGYLVDHCCQGQSCKPAAKRAKLCAIPSQD